MKITKVYEQVKQFIEQDVHQKNPGEMLPSEVQYALKLNVSRPTVRKAVMELVNIGLVKRVPGKGLITGDGISGCNRGKILIGLPFATGDGFLFKIVMSCIDKANEMGYEYKIINSVDPEERLHLISREAIDDYVAFVLTAYDSQYDSRILNYLMSRNAWILLIDNQPDHFDLPIIGCNDYAGGYMVGKKLIEKNHRNIMYINSTRDVQTVRDRLKGFLQAFKDNNVDTKGIYLHSVADIGNPQVSYFFNDKFDSSFIKEKGITALCGYSSLPIISFCNTLVIKGFRIPEDISVIGYGDYSIISATNIPMTTVETPAEEMGRAIVECIDQACTSKQPLKGRIFEVKMDNRHTVLKLPQKQ